MSISYSEYMDEITDDEIYDRLIKYGIFSEKLPPVFDCSDFLKYCKKNGCNNFPDRWYKYAIYNNMRNINIPRTIGIPTPMAHARLSECIKSNWSSIQDHFRKTTINNNYKISRIHIRKMQNTDSLFKMNYDNWKKDGTPETDLSFGKNTWSRLIFQNVFPVFIHMQFLGQLPQRSVLSVRIVRSGMIS